MKTAENLLRKDLEELKYELEKIRSSLLTFEHKNEKHLKSVRPEYRESARNFLHYLALRQTELKDLQIRLARRGFSSLGRCESYVLSNVQEIINRIEESLQNTQAAISRHKKANPVSWADAEVLLHQHTRRIFGDRPPGRHIYIMVTAPSADLVTEKWVQKILLAGSNLIRINCAHENSIQWSQSIDSIRKVAAKLKVSVNILMDLGGPKIRIASPKKLRVKVGDEIYLRGNGSQRKTDQTISVSLPEALSNLKAGHRILFDDGKFEAIVLKKEKGRFRIQMTRMPPDKKYLKHEKGINFPDSVLEIPELTQLDREHIPFIANNADLIGLSFVQKPETIRTLLRELRRHKQTEIGLVLKIETPLAFTNLPRLLLEGMRHYPLAVMVARGDLAIEVGFDRVVEVQEEILWLCEAAHIPTIWATQVLENHAKTGLPSRSEVTDAAHAVRAECVMLNKGPYIDQTVTLLDSILQRMEKHFYKKRNIFRSLKVARDM